MRRVWVIVALLTAIGCGDDAQATDAGPQDGSVRDAPVGSDAIPPLLFADFSVTGCTISAQMGGEPDGGAPDAGSDESPCTGPAPLTVTFVSISDAEITAYSWNFGDGRTSNKASPTHTYTAPGSYDITLSVLGPGGNISVRKNSAILVAVAGNGLPCTDNGQCASSQCVCGDDVVCDPGAEPGFCSTPCSAGSPCSDGVCIDLAPSPPASPQPWQQSLCLRECTDDDGCSAGQVCRELRDGTGDAWIRACFAATLLADIGQSCVDETGALDDTACSSGLCIDEGARGLCAAACSVSPCPEYAACATFTGNNPTPSCIVSCDGITTCQTDPFLTCAAPGGPGAKGFTVDETPANPEGYCAPKPCTGAGQCGTEGTCVAGFCQ